MEQETQHSYDNYINELIINELIYKLTKNKFLVYIYFFNMILSSKHRTENKCMSALPKAAAAGRPWSKLSAWVYVCAGDGRAVSNGTKVHFSEKWGFGNTTTRGKYVEVSVPCAAMLYLSDTKEVNRFLSVSFACAVLLQVSDILDISRAHKANAKQMLSKCLANAWWMNNNRTTTEQQKKNESWKKR